MQIKQPMLQQHLQHTLQHLYILIGQDLFLLEESFNLLKSTIVTKHDCDHKRLTIESPSDWDKFIEEASSYSLFHEKTFLDISFNKKTLDSTGKKIITDYAKNPYSNCFVIIKAPELSLKQLSHLSTMDNVVVSVAYSLDPLAIKNWIINQFKQRQIKYDMQVPELIQQFTQGNMLATAQVIEKISLTYDATQVLNSDDVGAHLFDQCEYNLFELVNACLQGDSTQAIQILRQCPLTKVEPTLVLWMLAQEIRMLIRLLHCIKQSSSIQAACAQLKIWPQKSRLYHTAYKRHCIDQLLQLHRYCLQIDEAIKTNSTTNVWFALENLALSLCLGILVGDTWKI